MACCGGGRSSGNSFTSPIVPGEDGFVLLEYTGLNDGDQTWFGAVTGQRYTLGGIRKQGYVDERDAPAFLALWDRGVKIFKVVEPVAEPAPLPESEPEPQMLIAAVEEPVAAKEEPAVIESTTTVASEPEPVVLLSEEEIATITKRVSDIEAWLATSPPVEQVNQVYEYEKANANRVTAVAMLEAYLGDA